MGDSTTKPGGGAGWTPARRTRGGAAPLPTSAPAPSPPAATPNPPAAAPAGWTVAAPARPSRADGPLGLGAQQAAKGPLPVDQVDKLPVAQRRWTINVQAALGLKGVLGQNQILASSVATATRIAETRPSVAGLQAKYPNVTAADSLASVVDQLADYEAKKQPGDADRSMLRSVVQFARDQVTAPDQDRDCQDLLDWLRAEELREEIASLGRPPWNGAEGKVGATAKVELDLLSIPADSRKVVPFSGSANATFWINRTDGTGTGKKSFICKTPSGKFNAVEGIPAGGEVAREGLVAQAAQKLAGRLGLNFDVPETHAIKLDKAFLPGRAKASPPGQVTCSVQEVRANTGDLGDRSSEELKAFKAEQCAALAVLDIVTLNTDRHARNLLVGTDGDLIPIDHGACLPEGEPEGLERIVQSLGTPRNILLSLPGTHEPMPDELRKRLMAIDPSAMAGELGHERDDIEASTPEMKGKVSDHALQMSARAATFLKIAAGVEVDGRTLSPADIQVALGTYADELLGTELIRDESGGFDERDLPLMKVVGFTLAHQDFIRRAQEIAEQALKDQPLTRAMSLMTDAEKRGLASLLEQRGWTCSPPGEKPAPSVMNDPVAAIQVIASGNSRGNKDQAAVMQSVRRNPIAANEVLIDKLADARLEVARSYAGYLPQAEIGRMRAKLAANAAQLKADPAMLGRLIEEIEVGVVTKLNAELTDFQSRYAIPDDNGVLGWAKTKIMQRNLGAAVKNIGDLRKLCGSKFAPRATVAGGANG